MVAEAGVLEVLLQRGALLRRLAREPCQPSELVADLDSSRSTVDRGLSELQDSNLVERVESRYRTTLVGELALAEFDRLSGRLRSAVDASDLLALLPNDAPLDWRMLDGAAAVRVDRRTAVTEFERPPDRPVDRGPNGDPFRLFQSALEADRRHRAIVPTVPPRLARAYREAIRGGLEVEAVVSDEAAATLCSDFREATADALDAHRLSLWEAPTTLPYGLIVVDDPNADSARLAMLVICREDELRGLLVNDSGDALAWARRQLERYLANAQPLSFSDGD
ncbi:helix-turn-helix transcriptional regulator [Halopiger djelfimassiliensis]|uniref:helix-turn-helix transcriptional regulator n=1 Tax=Halopiger djelfimassiliensis TaxID=1293047 RepID=UPI0006778545|nr:ArsR family transcriptional regulator [Halopiger djelfimassiliensis]